MKCYYCQEPCFFEGYTSQIMAEPKEEIWGCSKHPVPVKHYIRFVRKPNCDCGEWVDNKCCPHDEFYKVILEVPHRDLTYLTILEILDNKLFIQSFNGVQAWPVMDLKSIPQSLNPENALDKVSTWIVFS